MQKHSLCHLLACKSLIVISMWTNASTLLAQLEQREIEQLAKRASTLVFIGKYEEAQATYERAIAGSKWDAGKTYAIGAERDNWDELDSIEHGRAQLKRLLRDRPHMDAHGIAQSEIGRWCEARFAGIETGLPIRWVPANLEHGLAGNRLSKDGRCIHLMISSDIPQEGTMLFEESWQLLIFELINSTNWYEVNKLCKAASNKEIDRDFFVRQLHDTELVAATKCRAFYVRMFLPWAAGADFESTPKLWYTTRSHWGTPDFIFTRYYYKRDKYSWVPYSQYFDDLSRAAAAN